jgi:hypothetical protein
MWTGKYCCVPSVCTCSYLFHYSEIQQGCGRAEDGKLYVLLVQILSLIWWRFSTNSLGYKLWAENFILFSSRAEPFLSTIQMSVCWGYILSDLQRYPSSLLVNFILHKFVEVKIPMPLLSRWSVLVLIWEHTWRHSWVLGIVLAFCCMFFLVGYCKNVFSCCILQEQFSVWL